MIKYISILKFNLKNMAAATQTDNDDLLILSSEDSNTDTLVLDDPIVTEDIKPTTESDIISFDDITINESEKNEESLELVDDKDKKEDEVSLDLSDFSIDNSEEVEKNDELDNELSFDETISLEKTEEIEDL
ncbi:hypothetical protein ACFLY2_01965 [Patescibacteria group bacterium]